VIEFRDISKTFSDGRGGHIDAVRGLDLVVPRGEVHCLIGTSGCGKTTTLRLVNRLEDPTRGSVLLDGEDIASLDIFQVRRRIGYVIQSGGLFPHMTVSENIGVLCSLEGWTEEARRQRVNDLLDLVNLPPSEFSGRYPADISGGQRQRVGVARALALDPEFVLMDEPFGALDPITRTELHTEFQRLLATVNKTVLLVTHDLTEAFELGDRVSLMHEGELVQTGTAESLTTQPASPFVEAFVRAFVPARASGGASGGASGDGAGGDHADR